MPLEKEPESTTEVGATCCAAWSLWDGESKIMPTAATAAAATYCGGGALGLSCLPACCCCCTALIISAAEPAAAGCGPYGGDLGGLLELQQDLEGGGGGGRGGLVPLKQQEQPGLSGRHSHGLVVPLEKELESTTGPRREDGHAQLTARKWGLCKQAVLI